MQNAEALSAGQISEFLKGSEGIEFAGQGRDEIYAWTERMLVAQEYHRQGKKERGAIRAYLSKVTGLSLPRITRLIRQYVCTGRVQAQPCRRRRFPLKYSAEDVRLPAEVDRARERLSGPATRRILQREYQGFGKQEFAGLARISVSHFTTCAGALRTANTRLCSSPRGRMRFRLPSGASRTPKAGRDTCGSTRCTRATGTGPKGCTTSMPWIR